ncbi:MAG: molybdopterin-synthase adenylyltransferase MoeB [Pseudomonadota bacterium]|nr:molybdopterin-synthase adenylyltransferase MoeB [Pseudomonadota bacterium]
MDFTEEQIQRYARHIVLPEIGGVGQKTLLGSRVLVIGAGGLGTPLLMYLAAAGVGTLGIMDDDIVELSNLQRQVIHKTSSIGISKVESAANAISEINPDLKVIRHCERLTRSNVSELIEGYDLVADGSDNFETRFLVNDACHFAQKTLVSAAVLQFEGQVSTFRSGLIEGAPCYRCLYDKPPRAGLVPSCAEGGVLGALAGTIGSLQAVEVLKELIGIGDSLSGFLLIYDALTAEVRKLVLPRNSDCSLCGNIPKLFSLTDEVS